MRLRRAGVTAGVAAALVLGGCGGGGDGRFDDDVSAIREAVETGDAAGARDALDALAVDALAARQDGEIDDADLQEVAGLIDASREAVAELLPDDPDPSTTTTTITTTTTSPPAPPDEREDEHDEDDDDDDEEDDDRPGNGKGKGKSDD